MSEEESAGGTSPDLETKKKPSRGYLCFGPSTDSDDEGEEKRKEEGIMSGGSRRRRRWWFRFRAISKLFSHSSSKRGSGKEEDSSRSSSTEDKSVSGTSWKLMDDESRTSSSPIFTSSASPSLSFSSSSISSVAASSAASPDAAEPKMDRRRKLPPKPSTPAKSPSTSFVASAAARRCGSLKWLVLLLVSLSVIVFCGRLSAILWTSSCLCFVARWNFSNRSSARPRRRVTSTAALVAVPMAVAEAVEPSRRGLEEEEKKRIVLEGFLERSRRA